MSRQSELAALGRVADTSALSNRNLIINGAMQVAQRGTSTSLNGVSGFLIDRFEGTNSIGAVTYSQEADAPSGFSNSLKMEVDTAETPVGVASDVMAMIYNFEGQDLQLLKKGTADALPVTISFWVKSNVTGTYILEFDDNDNTRNINKSYTVNSAATWEYKTITFEGDTAGTLDNDNGLSARLLWFLDAGSVFRGGTLAASWEATTNANRAEGNVSLGDTVGNYWQITGVQLEVGDTATPFEHRSYGDELARCQRYFERIDIPFTNSTTSYRSVHGNGNWSGPYIDFKVSKRATPTISEVSGFQWRRASRPAGSVTNIGAGAYGSITEFGVAAIISEGSIADDSKTQIFTSSGDQLDVDAEL